jgi:phenylacetic acid degradation operon negative regulatory protein
MNAKWEVALAFAFACLDTFTRRDCGLILAGFRNCEGDRALDRALERWRREKLIEQTGRGKDAVFKITDAGRKRLRVTNPSDSWNQPWDGQWRVVLFDLPANKSKDRQVLWRALRDAKMGLLQRSVWISVREVESLLKSVVEARGIPECFCGFRATSLFLTDTNEVVQTAWDFEAIGKAHDTYLKHLVANVASLNRAKDLQELAQVARIERDAYQYAFAIDPLLPRELWPSGYHGAQVEEKHQAFNTRLRARLKELSAH